MSAPQYVMAGILGFQVLAAFIVHGKPREPWNAGSILVGVLLYWVILMWGGFWD